MKTFIRLIGSQVSISALLFALSTGFSAHADSSATELGLNMDSGTQNFWSEATSLVQRCSVQPIHPDHRTGQTVAGPLRSTCEELKVIDQKIHFQIGETKYIAEVTISRYADGDDLNDVVVTNDKGEFVGARKNVLAFNDPLLALAGGAGLHFETRNFLPTVSPF